MDKIAVLNMAKNCIGDEGIKMLMHVVQSNRSLVQLNVASNELSGAGLSHIFEGMRFNESIISLNISTVEGVYRNRMSKQSAKKFRRMLIDNEFMECLEMTGVILGPHGF